MSVLVTAKGQATIPKDVREHMGIKAGSRIEFFKQPDGSVAILPVRSIKDIRLTLPRYNGPAITIEQMDEAVKEAANARFRRSMRK